MANPICCGRSFSLPTFDILRLYAKSLKYRYVDGTPTPAKIQISHSLKVGQFYIDVFIICTFKKTLILQISDLLPDFYIDSLFIRKPVDDVHPKVLPSQAVRLDEKESLRRQIFRESGYRSEDRCHSNTKVQT